MQDIATALQELGHILRREEAQCDALGHNIQRERQALRTLKLTDMEEVNRQRAELLNDLHVLETERAAWLARLAGPKQQRLSGWKHPIQGWRERSVRFVMRYRSTLAS
jgi:flagellar biosynthesis/type III secretory pathway chaperone